LKLHHVGSVSIVPQLARKRIQNGELILGEGADYQISLGKKVLNFYLLVRCVVNNLKIFRVRKEVIVLLNVC
jgi:hypothetical protein